MKYSAKPKPVKPADPKRSPQRAAAELAKKLAERQENAFVPSKQKGKDPYRQYRDANGKMQFKGKD